MDLTKNHRSHGLNIVSDIAAKKNFCYRLQLNRHSIDANRYKCKKEFTMKLDINPLVDCVFKSLLGSDDNKPLLIHFLNAVLHLPEEERITTVNILNPYNEREYDGDKLSIVDIKVTDQQGSRYQVEIQLNIGPSLASRITYNWAEVFRQQLKEGQDYATLKPAIAIWILADNLISEDISRAYHHHFMLYDPQHNITLTDKAAIHTLELKKWHDTGIKTDLDVWSWFFLNAENMNPDQPPEFLNSQLMKRAMDTLKHFKNEKERGRYYARLDAQRAQSSLEKDREEERKVLEVEIKKLKSESDRLKDEKDKLKSESDKLKDEKDQLKKERENLKEEAALAYKETKAATKREHILKEKLKKLGIDPEL